MKRLLKYNNVIYQVLFYFLIMYSLGVAFLSKGVTPSSLFVCGFIATYTTLSFLYAVKIIK